jgi:hypothetical protein
MATRLETYFLWVPAPPNSFIEIEAGNRLGITTVQVLRAGVPRGNNASHYIDRLAELKGLLRQH